MTNSLFSWKLTKSSCLDDIVYVISVCQNGIQKLKRWIGILVKVSELLKKDCPHLIIYNISYVT